MRKRRLAYLPVFFILALPDTSSSDPASDWKPGADAKGAGYAYQVFSKESEGEGFMRYQVRGTIDAAPDALVRAVRVIAVDPARAPDGQTRRLISQNDDEFVVYTQIDLPALFTDRDIVTRGVSSGDAGSGGRRIDWKAIDHPEVPRVDGAIRIERSAGFWVFTPTGANSSQVTYETYVDLGGSLPGWLIQPLMAGNIGGNFENVAKEAVGR
jgi:hypothetical protein